MNPIEDYIVFEPIEAEAFFEDEKGSRISIGKVTKIGEKVKKIKKGDIIHIKPYGVFATEEYKGKSHYYTSYEYVVGKV